MFVCFGAYEHVNLNLQRHDLMAACGGSGMGDDVVVIIVVKLLSRPERFPCRFGRGVVPNGIGLAGLRRLHLAGGLLLLLGTVLLGRVIQRDEPPHG